MKTFWDNLLVFSLQLSLNSRTIVYMALKNLARENDTMFLKQS